MAQRNLSIAFERSLKRHSEREADFSPAILEDHPRGPDWVHSAVKVCDTDRIGLGLVAVDLIPAGCTVILFGGTLMSWKEVMSLPEDMQDIPYQVSDDIFFGVTSRREIGVGERINHSCNPNCGFASEMRLIAIRDILPGEAVTMDYATCSSLDNYRLTCACGEPGCRGVVRGSDWRNPDIQSRLGKYFQPYLKDKVAARTRRGFMLWLSRRLRSTADYISALE